MLVMLRSATCGILSLLALVQVVCLPGKLTNVDIARATIQGGNVRLATALKRPNITFGVLGGSITTGHGASTYDSSWWPSFERLLRAHAGFAAKSLRFVNGAVAGTNSDFAALCVDTLLPHDVDVVFIEFDINTGGLGGIGTAKSYEALARKVLRYPRSPALVFVHVPADHQQRFHDTTADQANVLLPFYQASAISLRDAYWHHGIDEIWSFDHVHPGDLGAAVMAVLAEHLMASYLLHHHMVRELEPLRPDTILAPAGEETTVCSHSHALAAYATPDWVLTEEHDKWGLVTHARNVALHITYASFDADVTFQFAYLESYDAAMGTATAECSAGCKCDPQRINSHTPDQHVSVENLVKFKVFRYGPSCTISLSMVEGDKVRLSLWLIPGSHSLSLRQFKVIGLMASAHLPDNSKVESLFRNSFLHGE